MSINRAGSKKGSSFLFQTPILPAKKSVKADLTPTYQDLGWPSCINAVRPVVVVHTDKDLVMGTMRPDASLAPNQVRLSLSTVASITWWKGVEIVREVTEAGPFGTKLSERERFEVLTGCYTQEDYHGPSASDVLELDTERNQNLYLQFRKAGAYGVHTVVCRIPLYLEGGNVLSLTWQRDGINQA